MVNEAPDNHEIQAICQTGFDSKNPRPTQTELQPGENPQWINKGHKDREWILKVFPMIHKIDGAPDLLRPPGSGFWGAGGERGRQVPRLHPDGPWIR